MNFKAYMGGRFVAGLLAIAVIVAGCRDEDTTAVIRPKQDVIYFDYSVNAEDQGLVTCKLQYRYRGPNGQGVVLDTPALVKLDGEVLTPDSAKFGGGYYEVTNAIEDFKGEHTISLVGLDAQLYEERFKFVPFTLKDSIPAQIPKTGFTLSLNDFPAGDLPLQVVITDASLEGNTVNEILTVRDGRVVLTRDILNRLAPGPINIELYWEDQRPLQQTSKRGGRFIFNYSLKRETILR